ncbi:unnamed protein product [Caenorhabditis auriculariae]|uniref:Uncharacterized protein n=1 Tax=Caenorhabditis auriculariae TaxID=2777116 RepID=A0A8S1GNH9_9PELO|nr:unnamed protein product [Caenorhabditis auriculariae]
MGREEELKELEELDIFFFPDDKLNFSLSSAHTSTSSASVLSSPDASLPSMTTLNQMNYVPLPDPDEMDDDLFFDLSQNPKVRSSSFGGVTQYSQQFLNVRSQFKPSLCPISSHPSSQGQGLHLVCTPSVRRRPRQWLRSASFLVSAVGLTATQPSFFGHPPVRRPRSCLSNYRSLRQSSVVVAPSNAHTSLKVSVNYRTLLPFISFSDSSRELFL